MKNSSVALARARGMGSLPEVLGECGGEKAVIATFREASVPLAIQERPEMPIPLTAIAQLFAEGGRQLGDRTLGLRIGASMTHLGYGNWARYSADATSLAGGLNRLATTSHAHITDMRFTLTEEGSHWVWRLIPPLGGEASTQYMDHIICPALGLLRSFLGSDWRPDWIGVVYPRDKDARLIEDQLQVRLQHDSNGMAIPMTMEEVSRMRPDIQPSQDEDPRSLFADLALHKLPEPARSISAIIEMRLLDRMVDIDGAARMAGSGVQALQRRLRATQTSYNAILELTRCELAMALLSQTDVPVADIAYTLGYEEQANFTRAFRRWTGTTPSSFRQQGSMAFRGPASSRVNA